MAIFATDTVRFGAVIKHEYEPTLSFCREAVVINDAAATLPVGTVLGLVAATGKYKVAKSAATDGSQVPAAVLIADGLGLSGDVVLVANTDAKALVMARGPVIVSGPALTLGAGTTLAAVTTAFKAIGILVEIAA